MDRKTENVVQNVGAMAEVTSVFYNSIIKQVPKDVALVLTQHFMDITIARPVNVNLGAAAAAAKAMEAQRRAMEQRKARDRADSQTDGETSPEEQKRTPGETEEKPNG